MTLGPRSDLLTVEEWMRLEDPPGGRYEILDGVLTVNPSASSAHNRLAEDLADVLRFALARAGEQADVTVDVEWRVVLGNRVREAPRPDVAIGWVDPATLRLGGPPPRLVVEVWDHRSEAHVVRAKRRYWAAKHVRWLWELTVEANGERVELAAWDLHADADAPQRIVAGDDLYATTQPLVVQFRPGEVLGWAERQALRAHTEATRANAEAARADAAAARAEAEAARADAEAARAERLAGRLRELGLTE